MIAFLLGIAPLRSWLIAALVAAVLAVAGAGLWTLRHDAYVAGQHDATQDINDANRHSEDLANGAGQRVTRCYGTGGTWDRARGVCDHSGAGE